LGVVEGFWLDARYHVCGFYGSGSQVSDFVLGDQDDDDDDDVLVLEFRCMLDISFLRISYHEMGTVLDVGFYIDPEVWGFDSFLVSTLLLYYYLDLMGNLIMEEYEWMEILLLIPLTGSLSFSLSTT
jgi:hypothetical protein